MRILEPEIDLLLNYRLGRIKFVDREKGFGFVICEGEEIFVHRQWLKTPIAVIDGSLYTISFSEGDDFWPDQTILFRLEQNERGPEAHDVVDALSMMLLRRVVTHDYELARQLYSMLVTYRVTLIKDVLVPKANNLAKKFDMIKTGETRTILFDGNDVLALSRIIGSPAIVSMLNQPNTRLKYEMLIDGSFQECENICHDT